MTPSPHEGIPAQATRQRIQFTAQPAEGRPVVLSFAHPAPTQAIRVPIEEKLNRDAIDLLTLDAAPKENPSLRGEMHAWVADSALPGEPPLTLTLHGAQVSWRPGRASILAAPERMEPLLKALVEFAYYENELRKLEEEIAAAWPDLEADTPLAYDVTQDFDRHEEIGRRMDQTMKRRIRFARIETPLYHPSPALGAMAQELGDRLREKARVESRLETLDGHLDVFEYVYELSSQRISETTAARKERTLEWLIIVLLATEVLMLLADLLWTLGV